MTDDEALRYSAVISWSIDHHQVPSSVIKSAGGEAKEWKYSGSINSSELRLFEDGGKKILSNLQDLRTMIPERSEDLNVPYSEGKWYVGKIDSEQIIVFLHDDKKVSRVEGHFVEVGYNEVRGDRATYFSVI